MALRHQHGRAVDAGDLVVGRGHGRSLDRLGSSIDVFFSQDSGDDVLCDVDNRAGQDFVVTGLCVE